VVVVGGAVVVVGAAVVVVGGRVVVVVRSAVVGGWVAPVSVPSVSSGSPATAATAPPTKTSATKAAAIGAATRAQSGHDRNVSAMPGARGASAGAYSGGEDTPSPPHPFPAIVTGAVRASSPPPGP
jgi:hypothetical protein